MDKKNTPTNNYKSSSQRGDNSSDLKKILDTPMTRDRNLKRAKENLPTLVDFIEYCVAKKGTKKIIELCSGQGVLADDFQNLYNTGKNKDEHITISRCDILGAEARQTQKEMPIGGRTNWKIDIQKLPKGLPDVYSIFGRQYIHNAPDLLEDIRSKLKTGSRAYIQFPEGLRSDEMVQQFISLNEGKNIAVYMDKVNPSFKSIVFEIRKESEEDLPLDIPKYHAKKNMPLYWTDNGEKVTNSELFYHFFTENDPERENIKDNLHS